MKATHEGILKIANIEIRCYVLENETRVLSGRGMQDALELVPEPINETEKTGSALSKLLDTKALNPLFFKDLSSGNQQFKIIKFKFNGKSIHGYDANSLAHICDVMLEARRLGLLKNSPRKQIVADKCEILLRSFAKIGIIALIDEATGYQYVRSRNALEEILDKFIAKELRKWAKTFPDEFYEEMFRLKGWQYVPFSVKRPSVVGKYTNDLVYERIAPEILYELKKKNPKNEKGRRKHKHFQWLTENVGDPRLREHLNAIMALMRASSNWKNFLNLVNRAFPKYNNSK